MRNFLYTKEFNKSLKWLAKSGNKLLQPIIINNAWVTRVYKEFISKNKKEK